MLLTLVSEPLNWSCFSVLSTAICDNPHMLSEKQLPEPALSVIKHHGFSSLNYLPLSFILKKTDHSNIILQLYLSHLGQRQARCASSIL